MNKKVSTTLLFIASFLVLIGLQGYYLYNSYQLEEKALNKQAKQIADSVMKHMVKFDDEAGEEALLKILKKMGHSDSLKNLKIANLKQWYTYKNFFQQQIDSLLAKEIGHTDFNIALKSEIYSIYDETEHKQLLSPKHPLILFKSKADVKNGLIFNEGQWNSNLTEKDTDLKLNENYHYLIKSRTTVELLNVHLLTLKNILPLLVVSILIIALLIYLFWRTRKNLNMQQQKVAQLYTSIDSIAHELNTPLTTLKFTLASTPNSETKELIERQVKRLQNIVTSITNQNSASQLLVQKDIDEYLSAIQKRYGQLAIKTEVTYVANACLLQKDFEQMMDNLIENAVKYGAENIWIKLDFNKHTSITVTDNGIGIPMEEIPHIFDKYYRISRAENLHIGGLGLGLYIVNQTVNKYKGNIIVVPNSPQGATFKISLPNES